MMMTTTTTMTITQGLFVGLFALPFLASGLIAFFLRRAPFSTARRVALVATASTALCASFLLPLSGEGPTIVVEWLPGAGPMTFSPGATGLYAALATSLAAFLALLGGVPRHTQRPPLSASLALVALAAANAAFLADHFLARYVALEVAALCVALAPLVELEGASGGRAFWLVYLLLRLGDAGLLSAILILADAAGTLEITPALQAAAALDGVRLGWVVAGFLLAIWVKLGGWPLHLWSRFGRALSLNAHAWLYAIVVPNLGAYLLYRVTPLLALHTPWQTTALWLGAGGAALAAFIALTQDDLRSALIYVGAAQAGLLLFAAACGLRTVVWLGLLATTPLRLLLFLAGDADRQTTRPPRRRAAGGFFALGGLALTAFGLLITWWGREQNAPLDALFVAEAAVAVTAMWVMREARRLYSGPQRGEDRAPTRPYPEQWIAIGALGLAVLVGGSAFGPLARRLATTADTPLPQMPTLLALLRYAVAAPALLLTLVLALLVWRLRERSGARLLAPLPAEQVETTYDLEEGLAQAARALHAVVEVGILEQTVALSVRGVVDGARITYRFVEQEGLEGLLRRVVRTVLSLSQTLKRWHTGLVRRNLLWIPISLALAVLAALVC